MGQSVCRAVDACPIAFFVLFASSHRHTGEDFFAAREGFHQPMSHTQMNSKRRWPANSAVGTKPPASRPITAEKNEQPKRSNGNETGNKDGKNAITHHHGNESGHCRSLRDGVA